MLLNLLQCNLLQHYKTFHTCTTRLYRNKCVLLIIKKLLLSLSLWTSLFLTHKVLTTTLSSTPDVCSLPRSAAPHLLRPFLYHQPCLHWKPKIAHVDLHHFSFEINFISSASPVLPCFTTSCICQVIFGIVTTLNINYSHALHFRLKTYSTNPSHRSDRTHGVLVAYPDYFHG